MVKLQIKKSRLTISIIILIISLFLMLMVIQHGVDTNWPTASSMSWQILNAEKRLNLTSSTDNSSTLPNCSETPQSLLGRINVDFTPIVESLDDQVLNTSGVRFGGFWRPVDCTPRVNVAILIPYRNRPEQLKIFLRHIIPVLERQLLSYRIFVIEQVGTTAFNKGAIYNIGFNATMAFDNYDCYIFHDVDLLVENDLNYYGCPTSPRHMSVAIDKFRYKLPYEKIFGGIQAFTKENYIAANGFSNKFWGWGGEDDDMYNRIEKKGFHLTRPSFIIGRYKMNSRHHFRSDAGNLRNKGLAAKRARNMDKDGLNTISSLKGVVTSHNKRLFTVISIDLVKD